MNKKKKIIAIIIIAVIGTVIFWKRAWIKEKLGMSEKPVETSDQPSDDSSPRPSPPAVITPKIIYKDCDTSPMKLGCKGDKVKKVQESLNRNFKAGLVADGYFGPATEKALVNAGYKKELGAFDIVRLMYLKP